MRWIVLAGGLLSISAGCDGVVWERDFNQGMQLAAQQGRRALVQFYRAVDPDCIQMDREVFSDPEVRDAMSEYVAIRVDALWDRRMAEQWNVQVVPTFFVIRPDGTAIGTHSGPMDAERFRLFLIRYRYR